MQLVQWKRFNLSHHCAKSDPIRRCGSGDITFFFSHITSRDLHRETVPTLMLKDLLNMVM